jgi:two-component system invasion response regulator UvrY
MEARKPDKLQIALIDDHKLLRNGLAKLINEFEGFEVSLEAGNGREFIEQLSPTRKPDIVLLDVNMPVMDGYETAKWIQKHLPDTKMLVLTMLEMDYVFIRMLRLGARGYLIKDSHPDQFYDALVQLRDKGYYINADKSAPGANESPQLTDKESEFLRLTCTEMTYREIAQEMNISSRTADSYRDVLFDKLGVNSRVGLVLYAVKTGIVRT